MNTEVVYPQYNIGDLLERRTAINSRNKPNGIIFGIIRQKYSKNHTFWITIEWYLSDHVNIQFYDEKQVNRLTTDYLSTKTDLCWKHYPANI